MVKIPRNESRQQVTSQGGIAPKSPDVASIGARVTQQLGGAVEEVANKFKDLAILNETTKADTEARRNLKEIEIEAANDPNPNNLQTYQDKISKAISKASNNITLPIARDRFNAQFASTAIASDFNVRKT